MLAASEDTAALVAAIAGAFNPSSRGPAQSKVLSETDRFYLRTGRMIRRNEMSHITVERRDRRTRIDNFSLRRNAKRLET